MSRRCEIGTCTRRRTTNDKRTTTSSVVLQKQNSTKRPTTDQGNNNSKAKCTTCSFQTSSSSLSSTIKYLKILGGKMAAVLRMMSPKRSRKGSRKVTSSENTAKMPAPAALDSHRAEAIDDCIQFINSSSSLPRSNSVSCQG